MVRGAHVRQWQLKRQRQSVLCLHANSVYILVLFKRRLLLSGEIFNRLNYSVADPEIVGGGMWSSGQGPRAEQPKATGRGLGRLLSRIFFSILDLKMASFGALWVLIWLKSHAGGGCASPIPLDSPLKLLTNIYSTVSTYVHGVVGALQILR